MSDDLRDTPRVGRDICPGCEVLPDPREEIFDVRYCDRHPPDRSGDADASVLGNGEHIGYSAEADGAVCRAAQQLIR